MAIINITISININVLEDVPDSTELAWDETMVAGTVAGISGLLCLNSLDSDVSRSVVSSDDTTSCDWSCDIEAEDSCDDFSDWTCCLYRVSTSSSD